nr:TraC family protein [Pseudorhizobium tarimense]
MGRIALRAGLGEMEIQEADLQAALEEVARRFRAIKPAGSERKKAGSVASRSGQSETVTSGADAGSSGEA